MREPFFKKSHGAWYVRVGNRDIFLDHHREKAWQAYRQLLAYSASSGEEATVAGVLLAYLDDLRPTISADRFAKLSRYAKQFIEWIGDFREVASLTRGEIFAWLNENKASRDQEPRFWSVAAKRDAGQVLRSAMRWALNEGMISRNPAANLRLEQPQPRTGTINYQMHQTLVTAAMASKKSRSFAAYLIASRCGARPQQIRDVTAKHVLPDNSAWVFFKHKTQGKTHKPLVVPLSPCLQTLTRIFAASRQKQLFLNDEGNPWTKNSVSLRFRRLREQVGLHGIVAYSYRHSFATDALLAGASIATVAAMLGHTDAKMVSQVYGHLDQHTAHLVQAAAQTAAHRLKR